LKNNRKNCGEDNCNNWCKNGGTFIKIKKKKACSCLTGFTGKRCEQSLCQCKNGGTCLRKGESYQCLCLPLFTGERCETKFRKRCPNSNCSNEGTCFIEDGNMTCVCPKGRTGLKCELETKRSDVCDYFCKNGGTCVYKNESTSPICRYVLKI